MVLALLFWGTAVAACGAELAHSRPVGANGDQVDSRFSGKALAVLDAATTDGSVEAAAVAGQEVVVQPGETMWRVAHRFGMTPEALAKANGILDPTKVRAGTVLHIPVAHVGATRASVAPVHTSQAHVGRGRYPLRWPLDGTITSRFGNRGGRSHDGIDIGAALGTAVHAAAGGRVLYSARRGGYGNLVILRHDDGLVTVYAHNTVNLVRTGQAVGAGQVIAKVGSTGRATGPHLHFEVRRGTAPENPLRFLPP